MQLRDDQIYPDGFFGGTPEEFMNTARDKAMSLLRSRMRESGVTMTEAEEDAAILGVLVGIIETTRLLAERDLLAVQ